MRRNCIRCERGFAPSDLCRAQSREMESQRKAAGLRGFRFLNYRCSACGLDNIFVEVMSLEEEPISQVEYRRKIMERIARWESEGQVRAAVVTRVSARSKSSKKSNLLLGRSRNQDMIVRPSSRISTIRSRHVRAVTLENVETN